MPFYAFRFDAFNTRFQRGKLPDDDLISFGVFVNQVERGQGAAMFNDLVTGASTPAAAVPPGQGHNITAKWVVGPLEIALGAGVTVVYSGINMSDLQGQESAQQQSQYELKILDAVTNAVAGAIGLGGIGAAVGGIFGVAADPIGKLLGITSQGPCNGVVFSDTVAFTGAGLAALPFGPPPQQHFFISLPDSTEYSFTRSYTDEATHDSGTCGHIAETDVLFSVLQVESVSVKYYMNLYYPGRSLSHGLRQFKAPGAPFSLRTLLRLRP